MSDAPLFHEAQDAAEQGQRERARDLLTRLLRTEKDNVAYWLLMSSVVDSSKEKIYCLQSAQRLEPNNSAIHQGLVLLGATAPDEALEPKAPMRRKWEVDLEQEELTGFQKIMANPVLRVLTFAGAGILVVGLILVGIFAPKGTLFGPRLTITPLTWTPTVTGTNTPTPSVRTPTPTSETPIPLWMLLEATYTPIPPYVNTPHPLTEAYRAGIRSYERGDYETMLEFMLQAQRQEPEEPDTHYYVGEAHRLLGDYEAAQEAYEQALEINPRFAPVYFAQAKIQLAQNPRANVRNQLEMALEYDPAYGEAYLELANNLITRNEDPEVVLALLDEGAEALTVYPEFYLLRAKTRLSLDDPEGALEDALTANEMDITILEGYLVLGQAYLANEMPEEALDELQVYGRYEGENPLHWALLGWAYYGLEEFEAAIESLDIAVELDRNLFEAFLYRGLTYLELGETDEAINDLYTARLRNSDSFEANFNYALALVVDDRIQESLTHFDVAETLALTDQQLALVYYNRALAYDAVDLPNRAKDDFTLLIALPSEAVPRLWIVKANAYLATATPTPTASDTPPPTPTPSPTTTHTVTPSPTHTATSTSTPTPTPTRTPSVTPKPTDTPTNTDTPNPTPTKTITKTPTVTRTPTKTPSPSPTP